MSRAFKRARRTRGINGLIPTLAVLVAIGLTTGISEFRAQSVEDAAAVSSVSTVAQGTGVARGPSEEKGS